MKELRKKLREEVASLNLEYYKGMAASGMVIVFDVYGNFLDYQISECGNAINVRLNPEDRTKRYLLEKLDEELLWLSEYDKMQKQN
jgi:hypothetical protein